jgi:anaphase-promoting complex subunit 6
VGNPDIAATDAEWMFNHHDFAGSLNATKALLKADAFFNGSGCLTTHICSLVELGLKTELFYYAHKLVEGDPSQALSWLAVGAYYSSIGKFDLARRHFSKATVLDIHCAAAWMGYGNAFAGMPLPFSPR